MKSTSLTWVEIDRDALVSNAAQLRRRIGSDVMLCAAVKANAYGHGLVECSRIFEKEHAVDWLAVNSIFEARILRESGVALPTYIMGYVSFGELEEAFSLDVRVVIYNVETAEKLEVVGARLQKEIHVHLKIETGNHRQGVHESELDTWISFFRRSQFVRLEGAATHFANLEDSENLDYSRMQMERMSRCCSYLKSHGIEVPIVHQANSAAAILHPDFHGNMVRGGIALYGLWPSDAVKLADAGKTILRPVLTWKTIVAQIKHAPSGASIGYGCSYVVRRATRLAILPVGYYDGYDRKLSNCGQVLIRGQRAAVLGRVCMNIIMVDVTDIPDVALEDEVVLIGRQGDREISAEMFAQWAGTINYEVVARIRESIERRVF